MEGILLAEGRGVPRVDRNGVTIDAGASITPSTGAKRWAEAFVPPASAPPARRVRGYKTLANRQVKQVKNLAKKRHQRRRRKWDSAMRKIPINAALDLGALTTKNLVVGAMMNASDTTYRLIGLKGRWSVEDLLTTEGPVIVGVADGDYTASEVEEQLEAVTSINMDDRIAQEQANRLVRSVATLSFEENIAKGQDAPMVRLNWLTAVGSQPALFGYNAGNSILTTGARVHFNGHAIIRFVT